MLVRALERLLFASRWLLAPFFVLLVVGLVALLIKAVQHTWTFASHVLDASESAVILDVLGDLDITLTALLIVIVVLAGYETFIARFSIPTGATRPGWLNTIDFGGLKLRLLSSIVAISAIQLLRVFMDIDATSNRDLAWYVGVHVTFVVTSLLLTVSDRLSHDALRTPTTDE